MQISMHNIHLYFYFLVTSLFIYTIYSLTAGGLDYDDPMFKGLRTPLFLVWLLFPVQGYLNGFFYYAKGTWDSFPVLLSAAAWAAFFFTGYFERNEKRRAKRMVISILCECCALIIGFVWIWTDGSGLLVQAFPFLAAASPVLAAILLYIVPFPETLIRIASEGPT